MSGNSHEGIRFAPVLRRFEQEDRERLLALIASDERVRGVCEDYVTAARVVDRLRRERARARSATLADYLWLLADLERELARILAERRG